MERKLEVKYTPVEDITPYKHNAKIHSEEQIGQIRKSIEQFGFNDPIAIDEDNVIIEGHGRLLAAKEMGLEEVPTIKIVGLTDQQKKAYILAHNQLTMNTGFDLDVLADELERITDFDMTEFGFEPDELEESVDDVVEVEPMPLPAKPKAQLGDIYQLGEHRLMCGDSTKEDDVKTLMNGQLADLLVTDPPYNASYDAGLENASIEQLKKMRASTTRKHTPIKNDTMTSDEFKKFLVSTWNTMKVALKPGGVFYIWHSVLESENFYGSLREVDLKVHKALIWVKNVPVLNRGDYHSRFEPCLYGWNNGASHYFRDTRKENNVYDESKDISKKSKEELVEILNQIYEESSVIYEDKPRVADLHPTMKPVKLISKLIINSSRPGESVLDLFGGSGTTMIACEQLGRRCYMMEYDPKYVDTIIDRWQKLTGKKAVKLNV